VFGLVSAILVYVIVSQAGGESGGGGRTVVVAKQDIPALSRITPEMLEVKTLPADDVNAEAFTARSQLVNRVNGQAIKAGEQILPAMVSDKAGEGLTFKIAPGKRAVSIEVKEAVTAGGNVQPGDLVDVIGIFAVDEDADIDGLLAVVAPGQRPPAIPEGADRNLTVTLLQNVKVLAVGQSLAKSQDETATRTGGPDADATSRPKAKSATLEVAPDQAQLLSLADEYGVLHLSVRSFGDAAPADVGPVITVFDSR